jgi:GMP synthase-like glutamine amidotransferase
MKILCLQHVPFETPAALGGWFASKGHSVNVLPVYDGVPMPSTSEFDFLLIMGGPMSVNDEGIHPWLLSEKKLIENSLKSGKKILGICLGAQLIASVCGARVYRNREKEIGWHPVSLTEQGVTDSVFSSLPRSFTAFHWHGETFDLPAGAVHTAASEACAHQAFIIGTGTVGLQFHLESDAASISALIKNCGDDMTPGPYVQSSDNIISRGDIYLKEISRNLDSVMSRFCCLLQNC